MRQDRGQLAIGLAAGFTCVLAMIGLVFSSSWLTREKMKLQHTTDMAALAASATQRHALNKIRDMNRLIEENYQATKAELLIEAPCWHFVRPRAGNLCSTLSGQATADVEVMNNLLIGFGKPRVATPNLDVTSQDICDLSCSRYDEAYRKLWQARYDDFRERVVEALEFVRLKANDYAFESVLDTFLSPQNLPFGLAQKLEKESGSVLTLAAVKRKYESGELNDSLALSDFNRPLPLFFEKSETRTLTPPTAPYFEYDYWTQPAAGPSDPCYCTGYSIEGRETWRTDVKVVRGGPHIENAHYPDYNTSYLTSAAYNSPMAETIEKFKLFVKRSDPEANTGGVEIAGQDEGKFKLLRSRWHQDSDKWPMTATALAKPYGGSFPEAGPEISPTDYGTSGEAFTGAKLAGIADAEEAGGPRGHALIRKMVESQIPIPGAEDPSQGEPFFAEDYLH